MVRKELAARCRIDPSGLDLTTPLSDLPDMDSLLFLELVAGAEEQWGVRLAIDALLDVRTGQDFAALVESAGAPVARTPPEADGVG